jgi:hypothetical protein
LLECVKHALYALGITEISTAQCTKLVGFGTDGAAANISKQGLKGLVEKELKWVFWMWCLAHRLELSVKDSLTGTVFDSINEMLLRLYYIYEKSPKKCRELEDLISDLGEFISFTDKGLRPVRASGSRWISHKLSAMRRILFIDLLNPCAAFSKAMQANEIDILGALMSVLRSLKEIEKLTALPLSQWPTYSNTLAAICNEDDGSHTYQGQALKRLEETQRYFENHAHEYSFNLKQCLISRLAWSDQQLVRDIITVLATQGWEKLVRECTQLDGLQRIITHFTIPLEGASIDCSKIPEEFQNLMLYAIEFISLSTLEYRSVWWRLFNSPSSSEWSNALGLVELLLSLPASYGKVERSFSQMNIIKTSKRSLLSNDTLDDLLLLAVDEVPLAKFNPDKAIDCWWNDKQRRPNQKKRNPYEQITSSSSTATSASSTERDITNADSDTGEDLLTEWDDCFK